MTVNYITCKTSGDFGVTVTLKLQIVLLGKIQYENINAGDKTVYKRCQGVKKNNI